MDEKTAPSKNNDCYFYYYSSCSKGDACPYRHEPSALRNETVCIFWLQGKCNKANCIFRHMELSKKRDKIACWFESQPGGCKKPHCPFQHQNILDHPREEDIKKKPDLILPVKKDETSNEDTVAANNERNERQIVLSRNDSGTHTPPRQVHLSPIARNPIIVPLQDGESDSESVSGSPYKRVKDPQLSAQLEWELRRLRQIQAHEADIIGYQFADDDDEDSEVEEGQIEDENIVQTPDLEEYVVEEILEVEEDTDAAHRRLHPPPEETVLRPQMKYNKVTINDSRKSVLKPQVHDLKNRRKVQISERLGGLASRALAETLGTEVQLRSSSVHRLTNIKDESNAVRKRLTERLGLKSSKQSSITERLGSRNDKAIVISSDEESNEIDNAIASRITNIRYQQPDNKESASEAKPLQKSIFIREKEPNLNFTVKSLADIRAEQGRKVTLKKVQPSSQVKNGTKLSASAHKRVEPSAHSKIEMSVQNRLEPSTRIRIEPPSTRIRIEPPIKEEQPLKILSLSEIKAKQHTGFSGGSSSSVVLGPHKKRSISPVSFPKVNSSKVPNSENKINLASPESSKVDGGKQEISNLGGRKISIKRSAIKSNVESEPPLKMQRTEQNIKKIASLTTPKVIKKDNTILLSKTNNNVVDSKSSTVSLPKKQSVNIHKPHSVIKGTEKQPSGVSQGAISKVNRNDSLVFEDEEELLLSGDMLELEDDIDEAALLL